MIKSSLINLSLKGFGATERQSVSQLHTPLRSIADRLLKLVIELVERTECPRREALSTQIDRCRQEIVVSEDSTVIERSADECLAACHEVLESVTARHVHQQKEGASLIAVVRETITAVSEDVTSLHQGVNESVSRFDAIATIPQILELKTRLTAEVTALKTLSSEHYKWSQSTIEALSKRVATLEHELLATQRAAALDSLTGIANRGAFDTTCRQWLTSGLLQFTLLLVDVDNLKQINDGHGHSTGDGVLRAVADALKAGVRSNQDLVARFGGDEFAVLAVGLDLTQAQTRFKTLASNLALACTSSRDVALPSVTMSCGVAEYSVGDTVKSLVQRADEALYEAKRRGKNCAVAKSKPHLRDL